LFQIYRPAVPASAPELAVLCRPAVANPHNRQRSSRPIRRLPDMRVQRCGRLRLLRRRNTPPGAGGSHCPARLDHFGHLHLRPAGGDQRRKRGLSAAHRGHPPLLRGARPGGRRIFASPDSNGATAALASTGMRAGMAEMLFTGASMIAAFTSILAGVGAALLLETASVHLLAAVVTGIGVTIVTFSLHMLWMYRRGQPAMA
jgi:hypothetical protein